MRKISGFEAVRKLLTLDGPPRAKLALSSSKGRGVGCWFEAWSGCLREANSQRPTIIEFPSFCKQLFYETSSRFRIFYKQHG